MKKKKSLPLFGQFSHYSMFPLLITCKMNQSFSVSTNVSILGGIRGMEIIILEGEEEEINVFLTSIGLFFFPTLFV